MSATIHNRPPVAGEFEEVHFGFSFPNCIWVEFETNDYEKWYGCIPFEEVVNSPSVIINNDNTRAFVVAGGVGHLIDIDAKELLHLTEDNGLITSVLLTTNPEYFVYSTYSDIFIIDQNQLLKEVNPREMADGIYLNDQIGNYIYGELDTIENQYAFKVKFKVNLDTFQMTIEDYSAKENTFKRFLNRLNG